MNQIYVRSFQERVYDWMLACFGEDIARDVTERNHRFLEEALELVQSLGCTVSEAHQLVDYVYGRPQGEINQELGGTMVTLAALANCNNISIEQASETELARVWSNIDKIRAKQAAKPKHSPLPEKPIDEICQAEREELLGLAQLIEDDPEWFVCEFDDQTIVWALRYAANNRVQAPDAKDDLIAVLQKQINDLTDPTLKSMRLENGKLDMSLAGNVVERLATIMTEWFRDSDAKNFVEITINAKTEPFESYLFYVQKRGDGAMTPAEKSAKLEAENARLRDAVTGAIEAIERNSTSAPVLECLKAALGPAGAL
ncbi:hypothetical protein [Bradyrhizobium sp. Tv2a-2]|uniref:hypothetical protein n=1 Tax=Bradyrhizobium sp. Tv2a-2 TaxID=113395 RepID=UPI00040BED84|nr:hypothetical protein [Bradyrhizobium sp. Tv2a-2]